jgi:hypothetical protein
MIRLQKHYDRFLKLIMVAWKNGAMEHSMQAFYRAER